MGGKTSKQTSTDESLRKKALKKSVLTLGWSMSADHEKALLECLMKWNSEVMFDMVIDHLIHGDDESRPFFCALRESLFSDNQSEMDEEYHLIPLHSRDMGNPPLWVPSEHIPSDWTMGRVIHMDVVGAGSAGKSALVIRWATGQWCGEYDPTIEDSYRKIMSFPGDTRLMLDALDTAGQDEFASMRDPVFREVDVLVICADLSDPLPIEERFREYLMKFTRYKDLKLEGRSHFEKSWDQTHEAAVILVGTKGDRDIQSLRAGVSKVRRVSPLSEEWNVPYIECSAKYNINVDLVFQCAVYECWLKERFFKRAD